jgi:hypothetical protein
VSVITVLCCLLIVESVGTIRFVYSPDSLHTSSVSAWKTELGLVRYKLHFQSSEEKRKFQSLSLEKRFVKQTKIWSRTGPRLQIVFLSVWYGKRGISCLPSDYEQESDHATANLSMHMLSQSMQSAPKILQFVGLALMKFSNFAAPFNPDFNSPLICYWARAWLREKMISDRFCSLYKCQAIPCHCFGRPSVCLWNE